MKKNLIITILVLLTFGSATAYANISLSKDTSRIYSNPQVQANFPGGYTAYERYVDANIPKSINFNGFVTAILTIEKNGQVSAVKIDSHLTPETDSASMKILRHSPTWNPATVNGQPVRSARKVAVIFHATNTIMPMGEVEIESPTMGDENKVTPPDLNQVFTAVEKQPEFPGGPQKFTEFVKTHLHKPNVEPVSPNGSKREIVSFVVEKDGSLTEIKVLRSLGDAYDAEVLRVLKMSPRWVPGTQNGIKVRVLYTVPISFD